MNTTKILTLLVIAVLYWTCTNDTPLGISQHELDAPDSNPTIPASDYTNGTDFSTGYYNGTIRSDRIQLEWTASTDDNFLCYKIFRAAGYEYEGADLSYSLIETLNDKTTTIFMDTTLTQNQYYTYRIANIIDTGVPTMDDITIKTPQWEPPSNIEYQILSPNRVQITWEDNSESEENFKLYNGFSVKTVNKNLTTYQATDLNINVNYQYQIKATNIWGETTSGYGDYFTIEFDPPSYLSANQQVDTKLVNLTWFDNSSLEDGFKIERDTGSGFELLATVYANSTSYTDTDTTDFEYDNTYAYRIRAYNDYSGIVYTDYSSIASVNLSEVSWIFVDFEDGMLPDGWSAFYYEDNYDNYGPYDGGWVVSSSAEYEGNYGIATPEAYYDNFYLTATVSVPQDTYVTISFYSSEPNSDGDGDLYINNSNYLDWDYTYSSWDYESVSYYTGSYTEIELMWRYVSYYYGYAYIDNIQVTW